MDRARGLTTVLTVRVPVSVDKQLAREARRQRRTRSEVARAILETALSQRKASDPQPEARRQSALAAASAAEAEVLRFVTETADLRGWK